MRGQVYELVLVCEGSSSQWLCHTIPLIIVRSARQESHTLILVFTCIVQRKHMCSCSAERVLIGCNTYGSVRTETKILV
jgi:hypothetical protein